VAPIATKRALASTTPGQMVLADASRDDLFVTNEDAAIIIRVGRADVVNASGTAALVGIGIPPGQTLPLISSPQGGSKIAAQEWWIVSDSGTPAYSVLEYGDFS